MNLTSQKGQRIFIFNKPTNGLIKVGFPIARTINEREHTIKQNEILDVFQQFVVTKGYEQMTISDILNELNISKGAFYHYFRSKQALLEAFIDRTAGEMEQSLLPIVQNPDLPALEKLNRFFPSITRLKAERLDFWIAVLQVWYEDSNAIVRDKVSREGICRLVPFMTTIIQQGLREGVLNTNYPDETSQMVLVLVQGLSESVARILLHPLSAASTLKKIMTQVAACTEMLERMLGTAKGALQLANPAALDAMLTPLLQWKGP